MMKKTWQLPPVSAELRECARNLRANMTAAERKLWRRLRSKQLRVFFHRQRVVGHYICDFVALNPRLVVEIDGSQHFQETGQARDTRRDEYLQSLGFQVLRFSNLDVLKNIEGVVTVITGVLEETPPYSPPTL